MEWRHDQLRDEIRVLQAEARAAEEKRRGILALIRQTLNDFGLSLGWLVLYFGSTLDATGLFATLMFLLLVVALLEISVAFVAARAVPWQPKRGRVSGRKPVEVS